MGAWDVSVFGNDDAADYSAEFDDTNTLAEVVSVLDTALDAVLRPGAEIEAEEGAVGLAAAALVVAWGEPEMLGDDAAYAPEPWPKTSGQLPSDVTAKAAAVFKRMKSPDGNELAELWAEAEELDEFVAEIERWDSRIS